MKGMSAEVERTDWLSYPTENLKEGREAGPPTGAIRGICQTALRCFYPRIEVLSGQGKGAMKEAFQVSMQELNESELFDEVSKLQRKGQKPGCLSSPRDKRRGGLGDKRLALALGIETAGLACGLDYGTVEATR